MQRRLIPKAHAGCFYPHACRFCCADVIGDQAPAEEKARQQRRRKRALKNRASARFPTNVSLVLVCFRSVAGFRRISLGPPRTGLGGEFNGFCSLHRLLAANVVALMVPSVVEGDNLLRRNL